MYDYHVHSNYSDGAYLSRMASAAADAGLSGVGFADHCTVSERDRRRDERAAYGFNLDLTHERRRRGVEHVAAEHDVEIYDAAEVDYDPRDENAIREFLASTDFAYTIGSVHELDDANLQVPGNYEGRSESALDALVAEYFETLVAMVDAELFDVAAHPDLVERTAPLRGRATAAQYRRVAEAFADSRTVPEINAGRALTDAGVVHPSEPLLEALRERDVALTVGTDAHAPREIAPRVEFLSAFLAEHDLTTVAPPGLE